jgi:hypothetical protein
MFRVEDRHLWDRIAELLILTFIVESRTTNDFTPRQGHEASFITVARAIARGEC